MVGGSLGVPRQIKDDQYLRNLLFLCNLLKYNNISVHSNEAKAHDRSILPATLVRLLCKLYILYLRMLNIHLKFLI